MKEYDLSKIMKRAWEIKREADLKTLDCLRVHMINRDLRQEEKALFSECLKMAWAEAKRAIALAIRLRLSLENASRLAKMETKLLRDGEVTWRIWRNYGKFRAYYKVSSWSNYRNNKKDNYVTLAV